MSYAITEEMLGVTAPVLSATLLARVHELNLDYLELLAAEHNLAEIGLKGAHRGAVEDVRMSRATGSANAGAECTAHAGAAMAAAQLQRLPCTLHADIAALSPAARASLASLPYTLYSLGFEDEKLWRSLAQPTALIATLSMSERYCQPHTASLQASLCEVALLYAWHVACSSPLAARLIYAMPDSVAQRLTAAPTWYVRRLAVHHTSLLMPRWPTNPSFWPDLVHFAAKGDSHRLATAKILGSQLIAAELQGSSLQSPRLRVRYRG